VFVRSSQRKINRRFPVTAGVAVASDSGETARPKKRRVLGPRGPPPVPVRTLLKLAADGQQHALGERRAYDLQGHGQPFRETRRPVEWAALARQAASCFSETGFFLPDLDKDIGLPSRPTVNTRAGRNLGVGPAGDWKQGDYFGKVGVNGKVLETGTRETRGTLLIGVAGSLGLGTACLGNAVDGVSQD